MMLLIFGCVGCLFRGLSLLFLGFLKMVVFSMNSKRIRRPSVRLWEVGDLSAAFTCGISKLNHETTREKKWKNDSPDHVQNSESFEIAAQKQLERTILVPGVYPMTLEDTQHNRENWDPNSSKLVFEFASSDDKNKSKSKLDFGAVTRRSRMMKRRRRNPNSISSLFYPWKSEPGCEISSGDDKACEWNQQVGWTWDAGFNSYCVNGSKGSVENEASATSKDACDNDIDDQNFSMKIADETWTEATWSEENIAFPQSSYGRNNEVSSESDVNSVREWLEELGFGKFACLFEMHEVDKETLPLLTFEDLKDMGIDAVGPRRKLFTAIQHLRQGN